MKGTKKWEIIQQIKTPAVSVQDKKSESNTEQIINLLLKNRGIKTKKERDDFLQPQLDFVTPLSVGIDSKQLRKAMKRIKVAIVKKQQIVVFGDYDVDGICGTAILWETLHSLGANVIPYIPHRIDEGYGLSIKALESSGFALNPSLIITIDNGIVANDAVSFANKKGIDVIITDHHVPPAIGSKKLPKAYAIVHTTKLCGTGVAWVIAQEMKRNEENYLELVALATIADLVPLVGANRTLTKFGLEKLRITKRIGLLELFKEAALDQETIGAYEVGHAVAPRLNAAGRLEHAMDSLRLLCTNNKVRAQTLAMKLGSINKDRQQLTVEASQHAKETVRNQKSETKKLLFISHESYQQGVIGLVAGRLVEEFYRPSIVVSKGETYSKASARSVSGFNIIEFIRSASEYLVDVGGHPMAAGFTVETKKLSILQQFLEEAGNKLIDSDMLMRTLRIDCELPFVHVTPELYKAMQVLSPFGMGNPEPVFMTKKVVIQDLRLVGKDRKHMKLRLSQESIMFDAIAFGMGERSSELHVADVVDIVYTIDENTWNGKSGLQLKVKDIRK